MKVTKSSVCVTAAVLLLVLCWTAAAIAQTLPFTGTASTAANVPVWTIRQSGAGRAGQFQILGATNNNTALLGLTAGTGIGVFGRTQSGPYAVWGQHLTNGVGVFGSSNTGVGVRGTSATNSGVFGQNTNSSRLGQRAGVVGMANAEDGGRFISTQSNGLFASGGNYGVYSIGQNSGGYFEGGSGDGVVAVVSAANKSGVFAIHNGTASGFGVFGVADRGVGVQGVNQSTDIGAYGVVGEISSSNAGGVSAGVRGINNGTGGSGIGVYGSQNGSGWGVWGHAVGAGIGVRGSVGNVTNGLAGFFAGPVQIAGMLTKSSGAFKIDHPLDPENKYLYHSFVESPDMKNIYDGNITTDADGFAVVELPDYFEALNKDFRYQLTIIGQQFAQALVWEKINDNRFTIKTDRPNVEVSWQVTGIRQDAYAVANPVPVEQDKPDSEKGTFLNPEAFGLPSAPQTQ